MAHLATLDFVRVAATEGTIPLIAYFPARSDFDGQDVSAKDSVLADLRQAGLQPLDLTECVAAVGRAEAFIPGRHHYSAAGNNAVARCLLPAVRTALAEQTSR